MDSNQYQDKVIQGIAEIKAVQSQMEVYTRRQIDILERLVKVEQEKTSHADAFERLFSRIDIIEEEVNAWRVMRKLTAWIGASGLLALFIFVFNHFAAK